VKKTPRLRVTEHYFAFVPSFPSVVKFYSYFYFNSVGYGGRVKHTRTMILMNGWQTELRATRLLGISNSQKQLPLKVLTLHGERYFYEIIRQHLQIKRVAYSNYYLYEFFSDCGRVDALHTTDWRNREFLARSVQKRGNGLGWTSSHQYGNARDQPWT